jgi:lipoyl-dependent peroxiredoxin
MTSRSANAKWSGTLKEGSGNLSTGSGTIREEFSFGTRFRDSQGTNPEELIGAAHAACYSMALAAHLEKAGFNPVEVRTSAQVDLEEKDGGYAISRVLLDSEADVPGIDSAQFKEQVESAAKNCVVSKALAGTRVEVQAKLVTL